MSPNLPIDSMDRAPSHHKPAIPRASDIAARLAAGETLAVIAAEVERTERTIRQYLNERGYDASTGRSTIPRSQAGRPSERFEDQPWAVDALCAQTDPEAFFPEKGGSVREAKSVCKVCDVRPDCLTYALDNDIRWGVWGGVSERERRTMTRKRRAS